MRTVSICFYRRSAVAEAILRKMMAIPRLEERLTCMITRRRFEMDLEEMRPELAILRNAADEIRNSEKFKQVLKVNSGAKEV